jgi:hypothetical protein
MNPIAVCRKGFTEVRKKAMTTILLSGGARRKIRLPRVFSEGKEESPQGLSAFQREDLSSRTHYSNAILVGEMAW